MRAFIAFVTIVATIVAIVAIVALLAGPRANMARGCHTAMVRGDSVPALCFGKAGAIDPVEFSRWERFHRWNRVYNMTLPDGGVMSYDTLAGSGHKPWP